jgi:peptide/nickel transport system permease protein
MLEYLIRRLLWFIPTVLLVLTLLFFLFQIVPGDPIKVAFGGEAPMSQEQLQTLRAKLGLDQPVYVRYWRWLVSVARLNLGTSLYTGEDVSRELMTRMPVTMALVILSLLITVVLSVPNGIIAGYYHDRWPDWISRSISIFFIAFPPFWLAVIFILILITVWKWSIPIEYVTIFRDPVAALKQLIIPAIILAMRPYGIGTRMIRSSFVEVLEEDYIRTARAKGVYEKMLVWRHALPNTLTPVITYYGLEAIVMVGAAVAIEVIFGIPGIGSLTVSSAQHRDLYVLQGAILLMLIFALLVNLVVDLLCAKLDPRVRYEKL